MRKGEKSLLTKLIASIPKPANGERLIIGIDGLSRSGKTTFVHKIETYLLEEKIPVHIFHIDDYIVEKKRRYHTGHEEWHEYYHLQWDVDWIKENLLKQLKESKELRLLTYEPDQDMQIEKMVSIPDTCLILLEGVFLQRMEWRSFFDFMIYLDCSREKRFARESLETQQKLDKFKNRYWKAEDYYLDSLKPQEQADFVWQA